MTAGFVTFRPNRLAAGEALYLWSAAGDGAAALVLLVWAVVLSASVLALPGRLRSAITGLGPCILVPALLLLAGQVAARTAQEVGLIARVSFGAGIWIPLFALPALFADTFQRDLKSRPLLGTAALLSAAVILYGFASGGMEHLSIVKEYSNREARFLGELRTHLALSGSAVGLATLGGVPLGALTHRWARLRAPAFFTLNTLQTIPSLALFGILIPLLGALTARFPALAELGVRGIGTAPALIALTVYSLLPIARNTYTGFCAVDPAAVDAGRGMGMTRTQLLLQVELPIASPIILNGIRVAMVQTIGLTAVAALIGAGGFGVFIFQGLGQAASDLILLGAIPTVLIAVVADGFLSGIIGMSRPRGLR
ncbi:MAG: ABC transporter permease [Acidobacteria bacterium]|uniref:ABC transporter permease n=1 Tax=Candidatus Polarisedimenticola svalbardensis TaxID=2886004 RepID=A0A8J7C2V9_9BACT|nr:ABC transporter permease [Candidatus Polarisedimenticola svalbardensis]